ncbi:MAG: Hsp20/alpha crystallin family protein [Pseudomonadota bacterium]|nr:Hsp20/alpha crystallin family protein [Pseudomonadota bacterium]
MYPSMLKPSGDALVADFVLLQDRLDEFLAGGHGLSSIRAVSRDGAFPSVNVGTWAEALEIYAFAPGIDPKSVDVSVEKGLLTISGRRGGETASSTKGLTVYAKERFEGPFRRVVSLPEDADPAKVEASYRNGVLKIVVQRLEATRVRQIAVNQ